MSNKIITVHIFSEQVTIRFFSLHTKIHSGNNELCSEALFNYILFFVIGNGPLRHVTSPRSLVPWCVACSPPPHMQHERTRAHTPRKMNMDYKIKSGSPPKLHQLQNVFLMGSICNEKIQWQFWITITVWPARRIN